MGITVKSSIKGSNVHGKLVSLVSKWSHDTSETGTYKTSLTSITTTK
jgi:hypothetical protein